MPRTLAWRRAGLDHACQIGNMAILLTSLLFVFEISFLPKYRVNYYDYIIKWCFGIQCNWCVSPDIAHILALMMMMMVILMIQLPILTVKYNVKCSIEIAIDRSIQTCVHMYSIIRRHSNNISFANV